MILLQKIGNNIETLYEIKRLIADTSNLSQPHLHVLIGLAIYAIALGIAPSSWGALIMTTLVQAANEVNDLLIKGSDLAPFLLDTLLDTVWTLALPLMLTMWLAKNPADYRKRKRRLRRTAL